MPTTEPAREGALKIGILVVAVLALAWFPFGFMAMFATGHQLVFGFDDFPLGPMAFGLGTGVLLAGAGGFVVYRRLCRGSLRLPLIITVTAVLLGTISTPAARRMTRIEQERRYGHPPPEPVPVGD